MLKVKNYQSETPNIFRKLFWGFIIVPIIPIMTLLYLTNSAQEEREKVVEDELITSSTIIAQNITSWVEKNIHTSTVVSQIDGLKSMDPEQQKPLLLNMKRNSKAITAVRVDDSSGQAIARSDNKKLKNYSDRSYFKQVKNGDAIGQQVIFGKTQQKPLLCLTVPINSTREFVGALSQCSTLDDISKGVTDLRIGQSGFAFLVDATNKLIAYGGSEKSLTGKLEDMSSDPALVSGALEEVYTFSRNGEEKIAYKTKVGLDWTLVVQQDYTEAFAKPTESRNTVVLATVLTAGLSLVIILLLSRIIAQPLQEARQETDNILGAVTDGLFLIDREYIIGKQQTSNLSSILRKDDLAGSSFLKYLFDAVTVDMAQLAKDYIDLLFTDRIKEQLIQSRNPLMKVGVSLENDQGEVESKYLSLTFKRVVWKNNITNLLVTVRDITKEVKLEEELEKTKIEKEEQTSLLTNILHIPQQQLMNFLEETNMALNKVNIILEYPGSGSAFFKKKVSDIFQLIHKVKGDAAAINFELFVNECHSFEDLLEVLKNKKVLTGNDFLQVTLALDELFQKRYMLDELFRKIASLIKEDNAEVSHVPDYLQQWYPLQQLASNIASKYKKGVELHFRGFKTKLPNEYQTAIKDIAVQLIRNSIVHGIEPLEERKNTTKLPDGQIILSLKYSYDRCYIFTYIDDGTGIDYKKIRETLIKDNKISGGNPRDYSEKQLLNTIFKSGFSSLKSATHDAGRGVGLSMVAERVKTFGGKIQVSSVEGKRTMFKIILPCKSSIAA